ncbi:hypothetical protein EHW97_14735 [Aeromicrobium camelliae]|uniref:Type IV secretion system protein n=1 Tax=Aeromicrobium camelliae TaxID=1538144 RepID=A0A3N6W3B0_9ACTN|nr:hypothetical protein EHW97_14735 [Aeromicrobium camelliae]
MDTPGLGSGGTADRIQNNVWWFAGVLAIVGVLVAGARMAFEGSGRPAKELLKSLLTLVVVAGAGLTFVRLGVEAGDSFSTWIIGRSLEDGSFEQNLAALFQGIVAFGGAPGLPAMMTIVLGLIAMLFSVGQIVLMFFRSAALVLLAGLLPLSAAATGTRFGEQWFGKTCAWIVAFLLYKPAAAIIYAAAVTMFGNPDSLTGSIVGLCMMALALIALPATMKLVVPQTSSLASGAMGGSSFGAALGAAGVAAAAGGGSPSGAAPAPASASWSSPVPAGGKNGGGPSGSSVPSSDPTGGRSQSATRATGASTGAAGAGSMGAGSAAGAGSGAAAAAGGPAGAAIAGAQAVRGAGQHAKQAINDSVEGDGPRGSQQ